MSNTTTNKQIKQSSKNTGINQQKLRAFAGELAKDVKSRDDIAELSASLVKMTIEPARCRDGASSWLCQTMERWKPRQYV